MQPELKDIDEEYKLYFTLTDQNEKPLSKEYEFSIKVIPPASKDYNSTQTSQQNEKEDKELVNVEIT